MTTEHDTLATIAAKLRAHKMLDDNALADQLERIDAEHDEEIRLCANEYVNETEDLRIRVEEFREINAQLRAKLAACETGEVSYAMREAGLEAANLCIRQMSAAGNVKVTSVGDTDCEAIYLAMRKAALATPPKPAPIDADHGRTPVRIAVDLDGTTYERSVKTTEPYARQLLRENGEETAP